MSAIERVCSPELCIVVKQIAACFENRTKTERTRVGTRFLFIFAFLQQQHQPRDSAKYINYYTEPDSRLFTISTQTYGLPTDYSFRFWTMLWWKIHLFYTDMYFIFLVCHHLYNFSPFESERNASNDNNYQLIWWFLE